MILRPALAALLLALAACGSTPPGAIPAEGAEIDAALVTRFVHRQGEARDLVFSPDGALLAATGTDGRIELMRGAPGTVWRTIVHPDAASALDVSPDGTMLVSGGYDRNARIWRIADQRQLRVLQGSGGTIWTVAWSPDGSRIATAGEDKLIRIWRAEDGALLHTLAGHELNIWSVRFSPDSRLLASGSFDHSIRLWDVASGRLVRQLPGHDQAVVSVDFSPDGTLLASGGDDSTVRLWRVADGAAIAALTGGSEHVYAVAFSPDGRWLASGGRARSAIGTFWHQLTGGGAKGPAVRLWRVRDGALQSVLEHSDDVTSLAFSPDGRLLATASSDGSNSLWRLAPRP
ncbi:MAG: hypothetical protein QOG13_2953 [Sphingomonadales bacterium]|jgi:WD40 repeat protein|nr:hypothetical protein [Sphingomonadales bacterium]